MFAMLDIHDQALQDTRTRIQELEAQYKPLHEQETVIGLELIDLSVKAWGHYLQQMLPEVPMTEEQMLCQVTPQDNLNTAPELAEKFKQPGVTVTRIEYDKARQVYRIYGRVDTAELAQSPA